MGDFGDEFERLDWVARSTKHPRKFVAVANRWEAEGAATGLLDFDKDDAIEIVDPSGAVVSTTRRVPRG